MASKATFAKWKVGFKPRIISFWYFRFVFNFRPHLVWTDQESDDEFKSEEDDDDVVDCLDDEHHCWELHLAIRVLE